MAGVKFSVKFEGLDKLSLELLKRENLGAVKSVIKQNGAELQAAAQDNAPVDTGDLKRSIELDIKDGGLSAMVAPAMHYAMYQELGTRFMTAQPFLGSAFNVQKRIFVLDLKRLTK